MKRHRQSNVVKGRLGGRGGSRWTGPRAYSRNLQAGRKRATGWLAFAPLWAGAALLGTAYGVGWLDGPWKGETAQALVSEAPGDSASFGHCHIGGGYNCVVDGDTIWFKGEKIRIADIDAPETHDYRCASEKSLGDRATNRLHDLLETGPITLQSIDRDEDTYGRKLRIVLVSGESVGDTLVGEGLARHYGSGRRPWC